MTKYTSFILLKCTYSFFFQYFVKNIGFTLILPSVRISN